VPIRALALAAVAILVGAEDARAQAAAFQATPAHSGHVTVGAPRLPLKRRWTVRLGARASYPVAAKGRVFVATGPPHGPARVIAVDARRGRIVWRRTMSGRPEAANLALGDNRLFVSSDGDPALLALGPADGRELWSAPGSRIGPPAPAAAGGVVVVADQNLNAYSQADGRRIWEQLGLGDHLGPAIAGDGVWLNQPCPGALRLRLADGTRAWGDAPVCGDVHAGIPAVAGRWMVARLDRVQVRDAATGVLVGGGWPSTYAPAVAGRIGLFADARRPVQPVAFGHTLTARRLPDGKVRWRFRGDGYLDSAPLIARGVAYVGSGSGRLYGLDLRTGRVRWRRDVGAPIQASDEDRGFLGGLAATDGLLLVPAYRRLVAFG
jgi:outer membrane protein assembly factor BamB